LIFEWWYYRRYGMSFIEQVSLNHISPWLGGGDPPENAANAPAAVPECKVWRNPLNLFRGAEYQRFQTATKKVGFLYYLTCYRTWRVVSSPPRGRVEDIVHLVCAVVCPPLQIVSTGYLDGLST
jgi:hypothetical protein